MGEKKKRGETKNYSAGYEEFYGEFPRHSHKFAGFAAYRAQIGKGHTHAELLAGARAFSKLVAQRGTEPHFVPHPATWLRAGRWLDDELKQFSFGDGKSDSVDAIGDRDRDNQSRLGAKIAASIGAAWFEAYFKDAGFAEDKVTVPTEARKNMILRRFSSRLRGIEIEVAR